MRCLCCNREIADPDDREITNGWHNKCVKKFFGTEMMPELRIDENGLEELANKSVNKGLTVPGVQKKLSLHLEVIENKGRFTIVDYPTGFILKPPAPDYSFLPEAEFLVMKMGEKAGINIVPCALVKMGDNLAYITRRVDRKGKELIAMEDFCQLAGRITADKYKGSYEKCGKIIMDYSHNKGLNLSELFIRIVFCFITGNSDMHYKNFSLIESRPGSRVFDLSPAYDMLPVNLILPEDTEETALTLNGKKRNIKRKDFIELAEHYNISSRTAEAFINRLTGLKDEYVSEIKRSYLSTEMKKDFIRLIEERIDILT